MVIILRYLPAILDLRVIDMSYDKIDARNEFPMHKLVRNVILILQIAQKMNIL